MFNYINISYPTKTTNQALFKCIMYIGKYYGNNENDIFDSGVTYISKKVKGATKRSVRFMVFPKSIKKRKAKQWKFKKKAYDRCYRYIINRLLNKKEGNREEAIELLHNLFREENVWGDYSKCISDILVFEQKELLRWAVDKSQYEEYKNDIDCILNTYKECDEKYDSCL